MDSRGLSRGVRRLGAGFLHPRQSLRRIRRGREAFSAVPWEEIGALIGPGDAIVEAGAADGQDTVALARHFPESPIIACEPVEASFALLTSATVGLANVTALQVALGPVAGSADMYLAQAHGSGAADSSSLLEPTLHSDVYPHVDFVGTQRVEVATLDSLAADVNVEPKFLWLDVQGTELAILEASPGARNSCQAIFMEVSRVSLYRGMPTYGTVVRQMKSWGFRIVLDQVGAVAGNVLFSR